jgi:hypothetical protein
MKEQDIINISEECEDCFENVIKSNKNYKPNEGAVPDCIAYESEPHHYGRMLEGGCPYLCARLSEIFDDNIDDVKRLWKKEKKRT